MIIQVLCLISKPAFKYITSFECIPPLDENKSDISSHQVTITYHMELKRSASSFAGESFT